MVDKIETKDIICSKDIGGEGEMISCNYKKKASEIYLHPNSLVLGNIKCPKTEGKTIQCELKSPRTFARGQMWSSDFDYCGMLQSGKDAKLSDGISNLNKLFDSYEDVNYHKESEPLIEAINLIGKGRRKLAEEKLKSFNKLSEETQKEMC